MDQTTINLLISLLNSFVEEQKKNIQTPLIQEKIDYYTKKVELYSQGMHGEENLFTLSEEDKNLIPEDKRKKYNSMYTIYMSDVIFGGENPQSTFTSDQIKFIKGIFHDLYKKASEELDVYTEQLKHNADDNLTNQISIIEEIILKLQTRSPIMDDEIELLANLINNTAFAKTIDVESKYNINKFLARYLLEDDFELDYQSIIDEDENDVDLPENEKKLTDEELEDLFKYFNYDYNLVSPTSKENLKTYGNIEKMTAIFEELKNITLSRTYIADNLPNILLYSAPEIIADVIKGIESEDRNGHSINEIFNHLFSIPSIFIQGRKVKKRRKNPDGSEGNSPDSEIIAGSNYNFNKNKEFFKDHHQNINEIAVTCPTVLAIKNATMLNSFAKLLSYGVSEETIFKKKSCLEKKDIYRGLDRLIEMNAEEYFKKYVVKAVQIDDDLYMKMLVAKKLGKDIVGNNGRMIGEISKANNNIYEKAGITESQVEEYLDLATPDDPELHELYSKQIKDTTYEKNSSILNNPYIQYLEENCKRSDLKYLIEGMFISRPKVIRIYEMLVKNNDYINNPQLLLYAITYNSFFSKEQYDKLKTACESIVRTLGSR